MRICLIYVEIFAWGKYGATHNIGREHARRGIEVAAVVPRRSVKLSVEELVGYHAQADDCVQGLDMLLQNNRWQQLAAQGYEHVRRVFALDTAIERHLKIYHRVLSQRR